MYGDKRGRLWLLNNGYGSALLCSPHYNIVLRLVMSAIIIMHDESDDDAGFMPGTLLPYTGLVVLCFESRRWCIIGVRDVCPRGRLVAADQFGDNQGWKRAAEPGLLPHRPRQ